MVIVLFSRTFAVYKRTSGARVQIEMLKKGFSFFKEREKKLSYILTILLTIQLHKRNFFGRIGKNEGRSRKGRVKWNRTKMGIKLDECSFVMNVTRSHNLWLFQVKISSPSLITSLSLSLTSLCSLYFATLFSLYTHFLDFTTLFSFQGVMMVFNKDDEKADFCDESLSNERVKIFLSALKKKKSSSSQQKLSKE